MGSSPTPATKAIMEEEDDQAIVAIRSTYKNTWMTHSTGTKRWCYALAERLRENGVEAKAFYYGEEITLNE